MTGRQKSSVEDQGKLSQWSSTVVTAGDVVINGTPGGYVAVFAAIGGRVGTVVNAAEALPLVTKKGGMLYVFALP